MTITNNDASSRKVSGQDWVSSVLTAGDSSSISSDYHWTQGYPIVWECNTTRLRPGHVRMNPEGTDVLVRTAP